ncbi:MAG TPA: hypothetical protein ENG42_00370 [Candidatus Aenigmarchaeota archaeon]|nr:hypothetical protein [Candidatus Aenigmarchaeota archaeon]
MILCALFTNWDRIIKSKLENIPTKLRYFFKVKDGDEEVTIDKKVYDYLREKFSKSERRIGGNAGNASIALAKLSIPSVLSMPIRPKSLIHELSGLPIKVAKGKRFERPEKCVRSDPEFEHFIFELNGCRKILTYDRMSNELWLDEDFWNNIKRAKLLYISGFHLVHEKYRKRIEYICDILSEFKGKVWLEVGTGTSSMNFALRRMLDNQIITHIGMNDIEAGEIKRNMKVHGSLEELASYISKEYGIHVTIHSREARIVADSNVKRYLPSVELSIKVCAALSMGGIERINDISMLTLSNVRKVITQKLAVLPTYINETPLQLTGLGDASSIIEFALVNGYVPKINKKEKGTPT